jgi:hypothetical protein
MIRAAHEANVFDADAAAWRTMERVNWREREQARNLCQVVAAAPDEPLLPWCGNAHAAKKAGGAGERVLMGRHFRAMSGIDQFVIDQTVTVAIRGRDMPWAPPLLAGLGDTLTACGGAAAILREQAPAPLNGYPGVDAVVVSADNELTS